jgi:hypothetical protein
MPTTALGDLTRVAQTQLSNAMRGDKSWSSYHFAVIANELLNSGHYNAVSLDAVLSKLDDSLSRSEKANGVTAYSIILALVQENHFTMRPYSMFAFDIDDSAYGSDHRGTVITAYTVAQYYCMLHQKEHFASVLLQHDIRSLA